MPGRIFVVLPAGELPLESLRSAVEDCRGSRWALRPWTPSYELIDKNTGRRHRHTGEDFDRDAYSVAYATDHAHCDICWAGISAFAGDQPEGYFQDNAWLCVACYEMFIRPVDVEVVIAKLPRVERADPSDCA